jgi:hypothetical protein
MHQTTPPAGWSSPPSGEAAAHKSAPPENHTQPGIFFRSQGVSTARDMGTSPNTAPHLDNADTVRALNTTVKHARPKTAAQNIDVQIACGVA